MALVWIKNIVNETDHQIVFKQNDPSYHPVIHSGENIKLPDTPGAPSGTFHNKNIQINQDQRIIVGANGKLNCDFFVIPWEGYGRLNIACTTQGHGHEDVNVTVGGGGLTDDNIKFSIPNITPIPCGNKGAFVNVEVDVVIKDRAFEFRITNLNSIPELKLFRIQ